MRTLAEGKLHIMELTPEGKVFSEDLAARRLQPRHLPARLHGHEKVVRRYISDR